MSLKNIDEQRDFLKRNLGKINVVVSAYIQARVNLKVEERKTYRGETYFKLIDDNNFRDCCGIMSKAWKEVIIDTFSIWWEEDAAVLSMHFSYEHIDGGHNGAEFCRLRVYDDFVTIV